MLTEEMIRMMIGGAIAYSGVYDDDELDELEWHHCFDSAACRGPRCRGCSGVPYVSAALWEKLGPVVEKIQKDARESEGA